MTSCSGDIIIGAITCCEVPSAIEMAVEQVTMTCATPVKHGPGLLRFDELVLSLKEGTEASLAELANYLTRTLELVPARMSSFERGLQTAGLRPPTPEDPRLLNTTWPFDLPIATLRNNFKSCVPKSRWLGKGSIRKACIRCALIVPPAGSISVVRERSANPSHASFNAGFRWLPASWGPAVRDLDVQRANLEQQLLKMPPEDVACLHDYRRYLADDGGVRGGSCWLAWKASDTGALIERFTAFLRRGSTHVGMRDARNHGGAGGSSTCRFAVEESAPTRAAADRGIAQRTISRFTNSVQTVAIPVRVLCTDLWREHHAVRAAVETIAGGAGRFAGCSCRSDRIAREICGNSSGGRKSRHLLVSLGQLISTQRAGAANRKEFHGGWNEFDEPGLRRRIRRVLVGSEV